MEILYVLLILCFILAVVGITLINVEGDFISFIGLLILISVTVLRVVTAIHSFNWIGSEYKKDIVNREYLTDYTREEVFFASSVIDTIRELERKRIEVNGDLLKED